jgi:hypothetical protein
MDPNTHVLVLTKLRPHLVQPYNPDHCLTHPFEAALPAAPPRSRREKWFVAQDRLRSSPNATQRRMERLIGMIIEAERG